MGVPRPDISSPAEMPRFALSGLRALSGFAEAEPIWRALDGQARFPAYQGYGFLRHWHEHVGAPAGVEPFLVAGYDTAGRPAFLLPFGRRRRGPLTIAEPLGGKHVNYNFGLWTPQAAAALDEAGARDLVAHIGRLGGLDLLSIERQPESWGGVANPFRLLPRQPTPSNGWRTRLNPDPAAQFARLMSGETRKKFRHKERKLAEAPGYRYVRAATAPAVDRALDAFFRHKAARMRTIGLPNAFAAPEVQAFLRAAAHDGLAAGRPLLECHTLDSDAEVIAVVGALRDGDRLSCMLLSVTESGAARWSPGAVLLIHVVSGACSDGLSWFDLGVGEASYKDWFCDEAEPLFDSCFAFTPAGKMMAGACIAIGALKRRIKSSPRLWSLVQRLRRLRAGLAGH